MAVFRQPIAAVKSAARAQDALASPLDPLRLKVGIHTGPSIAVTLNDRLDYFGTTVNLAAGLAGMSHGDDIVASESVLSDPEVRSWLLREGLSEQRISEPVKDFEDHGIEVFRVQRNGPA